MTLPCVFTRPRFPVQIFGRPMFTLCATLRISPPASAQRVPKSLGVSRGGRAIQALFNSLHSKYEITQ